MHILKSPPLRWASVSIAIFGLALESSAALADAAAAPARHAPPPVPEYMHQFDTLTRKIDTLLMHQRLGDIATVDEIQYTSVPGRKDPSRPWASGGPLRIPAFTFVPKGLGARKVPLVVFVHGGVHSNFGGASEIKVTRELLEQGYAVIAPEYRGSTGYGSGLYNQIDYGGTEIDDTHAARNWAVEHLPNVDGSRVGIIGWSHGGLHSLLTIFRWPEDYQVAYAGVPASDLVQRMGYSGEEYNQLFASFIGKTAAEDPMEYRRRSPVYHADKLRTPLLIHTATNDGDVNVMEVEHLILALKSAGKKFEYKIYQDPPGGHSFNWLDTKLAKDSRQDIYTFLARQLKPSRP